MNPVQQKLINVQWIVNKDLRLDWGFELGVGRTFRVAVLLVPRMIYDMYIARVAPLGLANLM